MFNILIVDDEQIVLDGLCRFVVWSELGYNVIGVALSATQAVKIIETEYVDVILTDIVMPGKNGLELIKDALDINPYIKTVILSGYGEFDFAKEALRLGAYDYLTKPVNFEELINIFNRMKDILNNEIENKQKQLEYHEIMRLQFLNNLVSGTFQDNERVIEKSKEIGIKLYNGDFCILRLLIDGITYTSDENKEYLRIKSEVSNHVNDILYEDGKLILFNNSIKEITILFYPNDIENLENTLEKIIQNINPYKNMIFFVGAGNVYSQFIDVSKSFNEAGKALEYRFIRKNNFLFYYKNISSFFRGKSIITHDIENEIQEYLSSGNENKAEQYIIKILEDINNLEKLNRGVLYDACIELLLIFNKFRENYLSDEKLIKHNDYNAIRTLLKKDNFTEVSTFIIGYLKESIFIFNENQDKPVGAIIELVLKYINEHYNENLTLQKLSEVAYIHPIYLSKLFKEKAGENFVDYLMKIRVEKSKKLLQNVSLRIYDICEMVGYDSPKHFSKVFKDITGYTPKDYRNNYYV